MKFESTWSEMIEKYNLGCVCFGWKSLPKMLFQKWGCLVGPENSIFRKLKSVDPKKMPLTTEIDLHFYFPFKAFPENERERERARAWEEKDKRDLAVTRSHRREIQEEDPSRKITRSERKIRRSRSRLHEITPARDPRGRSVEEDREIREEDPSIAISPSQDRAVDRDLETVRSHGWSRSRLCEIVPARDPRGRIWTVFEFFLGCGLCFSRFVFSFFFSKHQKIFSEKFFEMQPNTRKYFPFPEISISEKYVFSGKRFTATKHSLRWRL